MTRSAKAGYCEQEWIREKWWLFDSIKEDKKSQQGSIAPKIEEKVGSV